MKTSVRPLTAILLIATLCFVSIGWSCDKKPGDEPPQFNLAEVIKNTKIVGIGLRGVAPIVQSLIDDGTIPANVGVPIVTGINLGAAGATELQASLETGDKRARGCRSHNQHREPANR